MSELAPLRAGMPGPWEIILILGAVLILFRSKRLLGLRRPSQPARPSAPVAPHQPPKGFSLTLFIAQGFGSGRLPFSPGTFGSVVGVLWVALLVWSGNMVIYMVAALQGIAVSIWLCDEAEKLLGKTDPGCIVLDEIVALPFCFLPWIAMEWVNRGHVMPPLQVLYTGKGWIWTLLLFGLFRLFDIWKPWPIRRLQHLPGGWGVTVDDLLAAVYVAAVSFLFVR